MRFGISRFQGFIKRIALADCGQSMAEYVLICALLGLAVVASNNGIAVKVWSMYTEIATAFHNTVSSAAGGSSAGGQ
jgi:Flp pilus assembly pilin Flp